MNIEELKRLAELNAGWSNASSAWNDMINEGGAVVGHIDEDGNKYDVAVVDLVQYDGFEGDSLQLAKFYAAANTAAVLELIDYAQGLESTLQDAADGLKKAQDGEIAALRQRDEARQNGIHAMSWLADCRFAVGDNGKRMLPEFVEHLKDLKRQRDELLAALKKTREPVAEYDGVELSRYTLRWTNGPLPVGTKLYADPVFDRAAEENRFQAEELEHPELDGKWVAPVDATDNQHMQAQKPAAPAVPEATCNDNLQVPREWREMLEFLISQRGKAGHSHRRPGIWDDDNGVLAGKPCAECAMYDRARALLGEKP